MELKLLNLRPEKSVVTTIPTTAKTLSNMEQQTVCALQKSVVTTQISRPERPEAAKDLPAIVTAKNTVVTTELAGISPFQSLPEKTRLEAAERLKFLNLTERIKRDMGLPTMEAACLFVAAHKADQFPILRQGGQHNSTRLTWQNRRNWTKRLKEARSAKGRNLTAEETLLELAEKYRRGSKRDAWSQKYADFLVHFGKFNFHENCYRLTEAWRLACQLTRSLTPASPIPSISAARYYVNHLPREIAIYAREGEVAWRNKVCDYAERDWSGIQPGEMVIGDNRPFDTRCRMWDAAKHTWYSVRPVLSGLMDARSWYMVSWMISVVPVGTDDQIRLLNQYCVETGGVPPESAYYDNGMDYKAQGFALPKEICGREYSIFKSLGMTQTFAKPFNGRAKTIEPNFKNIMLCFDKMFPDYLGSHVLQRTDAAAYYDKHPEELPTLDTFVKLFYGWLTEYHRRPKSGIIHQGKSPEEIWNSRPQKPAMSGEDLKLAMLRPLDSRTIGRGRSITINNRHYFTDTVLFGERVVVKEDLNDADSMYLFDREGALIGIARTREAVKAFVRGDEYEEAKLRERMKRQSLQEKQVKMMARALIGPDKVSPLEWLLTAGTNVRFVKRGEIGTVKGKSHVYKRIAPEVDVVAQSVGADPDRPALPEDTFLTDGPDRPDKSDFAEIEALSAARTTIEEEEADDLSDIHNFITTHKKGEEENEQ